MAKQVIVDKNSYTIPTQGQNPPWGEDLSDLLEAIVSTLNTLSGPNDILTTNPIDFGDNETNFKIEGLLFDTSVVRSAIINYSIYRKNDSTEISECGVILATYNSTNKWELAQHSVGYTKVEFSVDNSGQFFLKSIPLTGTGTHTGKLQFNAKAFSQ